MRIDFRTFSFALGFGNFVDHELISRRPTNSQRWKTWTARMGSFISRCLKVIRRRWCAKLIDEGDVWVREIQNGKDSAFHSYSDTAHERWEILDSVSALIFTCFTSWCCCSSWHEAKYGHPEDRRRWFRIIVYIFRAHRGDDGSCFVTVSGRSFPSVFGVIGAISSLINVILPSIICWV